MGPSQNLAPEYRLLKEINGLLPKTPENELLALKVWEIFKNSKKKENSMAGFELVMHCFLIHYISALDHLAKLL